MRLKRDIISILYCLSWLVEDLLQPQERWLRKDKHDDIGSTVVYFLFERLFCDHLMRQLSLSLFEERETLIQKMYSYVLVFHKKNVFSWHFVSLFYLLIRLNAKTAYETWVANQMHLSI